MSDLPRCAPWCPSDDPGEDCACGARAEALRLADEKLREETTEGLPRSPTTRCLQCGQPAKVIVLCESGCP